MIIPRSISFNLWANQLIIDYPQDTIPVASSEDKWKEWGTKLAQSNSFAKAGVPTPSNEKDWKEWASKVYQLMM